MTSALTVVEISRWPNSHCYLCRLCLYSRKGAFQSQPGERGYSNCAIGPGSTVCASRTCSWASFTLFPELEDISGCPNSCHSPDHLLHLAVLDLRWTSQMGMYQEDQVMARVPDPHSLPLTLVISRQSSAVCFINKGKSHLMLGVRLISTFPSAYQPVPSVSPTPLSDQLVGGPAWQLSVLDNQVSFPGHWPQLKSPMLTAGGHGCSRLGLLCISQLLSYLGRKGFYI